MCVRECECVGETEHCNCGVIMFLLDGDVCELATGSQGSN